MGKHQEDLRQELTPTMQHASAWKPEFMFSGQTTNEYAAY